MPSRPQYGGSHQEARRLALAAFKDGSPCWRCQRPMRVGQRLDLDHIRPVVLGGTGGPTALVHARCNRAAGARLGNHLRKLASQGKRVRHPPLPRW